MKTKLPLITILCVLFAVIAQAEPYTDTDGCLTITWDVPTQHATLAKYFVRIINSDGDIKKQDETILNRYDWIYALEGFTDGELVTINIWAVGITVDISGKIIPLWSSASTIEATLNKNVQLTEPQSLAVN